jgi:uncharacterized protein YbaP (TraB family)
MKSFLAARRGLSFGLVGLLLFQWACGVAQARGEAAVWSVKGERNTVYLAGSVHALPRDHAEFSPQLERAYAAARVVYMEVDLDDMNPLEAMQFVTSRGTLPQDQTLADLVGADQYARVNETAQSLDVPEIVIDRLEPWAAAMVLTQFALQKSGFDPALGIDMQLVERARADGKPIEGLETVIDQLSIFDGRSMEEQTRFLIDSVDDMATLERDLARLVEAWRTGDMRGLEREFEKERAQAPGLYDELLGARNRKWLPKIVDLLDDEQDYLVVVGTLHFVGRDGLLTLLKRAGHKPSLLPRAPTTATR